jgi:chromosome partitioning protein
MKVLCIHFKGGVGKSTTAVHVAGVLQNSGNTLLIDGDRQVNSYRFFNGGDPPSTDEIVQIDENLAIVPMNPLQASGRFDLNKRIAKILKGNFQNFVFDTTPDPFTANSIITEVEPDLILVPVKYDDQGGLAQLKPVLQTIQSLVAVGISPAVKIVPIGLSIEFIRNFLGDSYAHVEISEPLPADPNLFGRAVFEEYDYAWNYDGQAALYTSYSNIALG